MMSEIIAEFIDEARAVSIEAAARLLGLSFRKSGWEHPQPCPVTGGTDRFAFNTRKNNWHCRGCAIGGSDAIGMAAHVLGFDLARREGLVSACEAVLGRAAPDEASRESEAERAARLERMAAARQKAAREAAARDKAALDFREAERRKARGIWEAAGPIAGTVAARYLELRCGVCPDGRALRFHPDLTYWHGQDEMGKPLALHSGPAMVGSFIVLTPEGLRTGRPSDDVRSDLPTAAGRSAVEIIGCHVTWIDLKNPPKYRPSLFALTPEGLRAGRPSDDGRSPLRPSAEGVVQDGDAAREPLPTKKMRGSKKGGLIPLAGRISASRWVGGEGIENGLAFAGWEGFRADTFYFAAGDLGNLAGPAEPGSSFAHPDLRKADRNGVMRPAMVPGPVPREGQEPGEAMWVGDWVDELVLLADGDSERVFTASAMARAKARLAWPGRLIPCVWPMAGADFAMMAADA